MTPRELLVSWLSRQLAVDATAWLAKSAAQVESSGKDGDVYLAVSLVTRKVGKADLALGEGDLREAKAIRPGWDPRDWSADQAARVLLLLALERDPPRFARVLEQLCNSADVSELVAFYRGLPLYPDQPRYLARATEGLRTNIKAATTRRNEVLDHMATSKYITITQDDGAKQMPIQLHIISGKEVDSCAESTAPFFCDYVRTQLSNDKALGAKPEERSRRLYEGGLQIHTTLDPKVQAAAQNAVDQTIGRDSRAAAPIAVVQPGTGNILAMAVNRYYGADASHNETKVNLVTQEATINPRTHRRTPAAFEPGSAFKAFTMATALEQGYGLSTAFYSPGCLNPDTWPDIKNIFPLTRTNNAKDSCPQGYSNSADSEAGVFDMRSSTAKSVNKYYIQLEAKVGVMNVAAMAQRLGIPKIDMPDDLGPTFGGLTLSQQTEIPPLDMAGAYAVFAAGGQYCTPRFVTSATDSAKENVDIAPKPDCKQVISKGIADTVANVLSSVVSPGGTVYPNATIGRPVAGKTGTNDGYASAWFIGFTPQMAAAVALGDPRGSNYPLTNLQADGRTWSHVFGGDLPALIFGRTLKPALQGQPVEPLPQPDPTVAQGTKGGLQNSPPPSTASPSVDPLTGLPLNGQAGQPGNVTLTPQLPGQGGGNLPGGDNGTGGGNDSGNGH